MGAGPNLKVRTFEFGASLSLLHMTKALHVMQRWLRLDKGRWTHLVIHTNILRGFQNRAQIDLSQCA